MVRGGERAGSAACGAAGAVRRARAVRVAAGALLALTAGLCGRCAWGTDRSNTQQPQPWVTMSLASLGVPAIPASFLEVGASMLTVHLVDDTHLLVTYSTRGLVPRIPGDPPEDEDRMVAAELVELPTGRVVSRTEWHMHDHGRYLWRLGEGRFLVRIRRSLYVLTPEARLKDPDPLARVLLPVREGVPVEAIVSADNGMLMVETVTPKSGPRVEQAGAGVLVSERKPAVMIDFFRLKGGDAPGTELMVKAAGVVEAPEPILLPADGDGYLWPGDPQRGGRWPVSFNEYGGREVTVGPVDSSCEPRLQMVSRSEYLAFTCGGTAERSKMKLYGMDGHETWEDSVGGTFGVPEFAFAPAAGRFAMSRISSPTAGEMADLGFGSVLPSSATQEMRVYQTESGDLLLSVKTTPVTRYAENFDLSDDGMVAAAVVDGAVEVYRLPAPSKKDLKDLEEARGFSPPVSEAPVSFAKLEAAEKEAEEDAAEAEKPAVVAASAVAGTVAAGGDSAAGNSGKGGAKMTAVADVSGGPEGGSAPVAGDVSRAGASSAAGVAGGGTGDAATDGDATGGDAAVRKPPTLLEPGESVETVKGSGQQPN